MKTLQKKNWKELNIKVKDCGILIDEENTFLGSSSYGLIDDNGMIEIKCPNASFGQKVDDQIIKRKITCYSMDRKSKEFFGVYKMFLFINGPHPC